jgi:hypothetical protein
MPRPKRKGPEYKNLIKCVDCGRGRYIKDQDFKAKDAHGHKLVKRCEECQETHTKAKRAAAARDRRANERRIREKKTRKAA